MADMFKKMLPVDYNRKLSEQILKEMTIATRNPYANLDAIYNVPITFDEPKPEDKGTEEWVWITGYKGTDKNMKCRDYQFELGKQFDMPEGEAVALCSSGFHLCQDLKNVYQFYKIGNGNRFFEVRALVRRWNKDGQYVYEHRGDKFTSKSIKFIRELSVDEIFDAFVDADAKSWSEEHKKMALKTSISIARSLVRESDLVKLGYSEAFASYVVDHHGYEIAQTMATMPDVSMDVRVMTIMMEIKR